MAQIAPNIFHSSKWKLKFSNLPTIANLQDMVIYDNYVKNLNIPGTKVDITESHYKGNIIQHPMQTSNRDLESIIVTFVADEELKNYFYLFEWMQQLRYGQDVDTDNVRENKINYINAVLLDNEKREKTRLSFTHAFCNNISALSLNMGSDEEVTFTASFVYEQVQQY